MSHISTLVTYICVLFASVRSLLDPLLFFSLVVYSKCVLAYPLRSPLVPLNVPRGPSEKYITHLNYLSFFLVNSNYLKSSKNTFKKRTFRKMSWPFSRNLVKEEPLFLVSKNQEKFALSNEYIISLVPCVNREIIFGGGKDENAGGKDVQN